MENLEQYVQDFSGCSLVVSHDRAFLDLTCDELFVLDMEGNISFYPGPYSEWRAFEQAKKEQAKKEQVKKEEAQQKALSEKQRKKTRGFLTEKREKRTQLQGKKGAEGAQYNYGSPSYPADELGREFF